MIGDTGNFDFRLSCLAKALKGGNEKKRDDKMDSNSHVKHQMTERWMCPAQFSQSNCKYASTYVKLFRISYQVKVVFC